MDFNKNKPPASISMSIMRLARALRRRPSFAPHMPRASHGAIWLLQVVSSNEGISSRELAELMDIRPSSLTEMLDRAEKEELVVRVKDVQDQRVSRISLTKSGKKLLKDVSELWRDHDDFSDILSDEETAIFLELCDKLYKGLENKFSDEAATKPWGFTPPFKAHGPGSRGPGRFHGPGTQGCHDVPTWPWPYGPEI